MTESRSNVVLQNIMGSYIVARCLHVIADLGVADLINETPQTAHQLATALNVDADALNRVLTLLCSYGVFEPKGDTFVHSSASQLLRSDHPQSMRAFIRTFGSQGNWQSYEILEYSIRTGLPAFDQVFPEGRWSYLADHPEEASLFNAAMAAKAQAHVSGIISTYDFSNFSLVGDIGGGKGHLLRAVLEAASETKGILFDLPHVIDKVKHLASDRLSLQAGDFFKDTLPACDAYILMEVIHDWNDSQAVAILQKIRQVALSGTKILVIEQIISDEPGPDWARVLDIHMMAINGGRQRTLQEYISLFETTGFSFLRSIDTHTGIMILEAYVA